MTDRRELARDWCEFATNGAIGRKVDDPVYKHVVEGRDRGPRYSSCGDLAHWLLYLLGCRANWINRKQHLGWEMGVNMNRLSPKEAYGVNPCARTWIGQPLQVGDILIHHPVGDFANLHVNVYGGEVDGQITTWDYGQGPMSEAAWKASREHIEGRRKTRPAPFTSLRYFISLDRVPWSEEPLLAVGASFDAIEAGLL